MTVNSRHELGSVPCRTALVVASAVLVGLLPACQHVAPYARGRLAHPTMATGDRAGPGEAHVYAVQEGAVGGNVGAESGCGCN